ncbi:MAG: YdcF family protein [Ignavibacteriaceae bacterium]|nr:YdcF family protein [Ignavibacteriaceae bacterium]
MPVRRKKQSSSFPIKEIALFILPLVNLFLLFALKYRNQNLPLAEFKIAYPGNVLNLFFVSILLIEFIILAFRYKGGFSERNSFSFKLLVVQLLFLLVAALFVVFEIHLLGGYLFSFPIAKILVWVLFFSSQFVQFILVSYCWLLIFKTNSLLYLRTIIHGIFIAIFLYGFVFLYALGTYPVEEKNEPTGEVGVVLGAAVWSNNVPSTILMERLDKARELYQKKKIKKIQLTGGNAPGELSEAEVAFNYLTKFPVDPKDVWMEKKTASTTEQIRFIKNELIGEKKIQNVVIISDRFHLKRINEISKFYNIKVKLSGSNVTLNSKSLVYYKLREGIALINFWFFAI